MDAGNRPRIERLPSGEFQFVRPLSAHRPSHESTRPKAHERAARKKEDSDRARRTPLSTAEIEHLITIYAATGEGRGAYLAAIASEERQYGPGGRDFYQSQRRYNLPRRDHRWFHPSDDDDDDDDDDDYRRGGRGPTQGPPSGPSPTRIARTWDRPYGRYRDGTYDAHPMTRRDIYQQRANVRNEAVERPIPIVVSGGLQSVHSTVVTDERSGHHPATEKKVSHVEEEPGKSRQRGRSPGIESYDRPRHTARQTSRSQPGEERLYSVDRVTGRDRSSRRQQPIVFHSSNEWPERRDSDMTSGRHMQIPQYTVNNSDQGSTGSGVRQRGGGGSDYEREIFSSTEDSQYSVHLRGGADPLTLRRPTTKASAIGARLNAEDTPKLIDTPREIELYFYYSSRGKIICSGKHEHYNTFQELLPGPVGRRHRAYCADAWLVNKLHEHYRLLRRSQQRYPWDLISMKTIGFASFIRFQHSNPNNVMKTRDRTDYIVTAKDNAIHADPLESALQQFKYLMDYPPRSKIMLCHLDQITRESQYRDPKNIDDFYAVEIKETLDTRKIWILLILLIVASTGGGTAYAVIKSDTSTGLALATYILTVLGITIAFIGAGEYFGMQKPDPFSFVYSLEENQVLRANHVHNLFRR